MPGDECSCRKGVLSHLPENEILKEIASKENVSVSSLATLSVSSTTKNLYNAISEYAAISANSPVEHKSFQIMPNDAFEREEASDDEDSDSDDGYYFYCYPTPKGGTGLEKAKGQTPKLLLGLGQTCVVWPPLPQFRAEAVAQQRIKAAHGPKSASTYVNSCSVPGKEANGPEEDERRLIYIIHYSRGEPKLKYREYFIQEYEIMLVATGGDDALRQFSKEVIQWRIDKDHRESRGHFALYRFKTDECGDGHWAYEGLKRARPLDTVILREKILDEIIEDTRRFLRPETKAWYVRHGLPHRRAFLFYGAPGTGKTSTIRAIASTFNLNCCYLSMTNKKFSNQALCEALSRIPQNALLVLEDVDSLFNEERKSDNASPLTFSGLLNALDGVISVDGVITVMTTNFIDRLDDALIRGGRVDRRFLFSAPDHDQIARHFKSFYPDVEEGLADKFANLILKRPEGKEAKSIGTIQQIFIHHFHDSAEDCIAGIPAFYESYFPSSKDTSEKTKRDNKCILC